MRSFSFLLASTLVLHGTAQSTAVEIRDNRTSLLIGKSVQILEEPDQSISFEQIRNSTDWRQSTEEVPNLGVSDRVHWLRFKVINRTDVPGLLLQFAQPEIESLEVLVMHGDTAQPLMRAGQIFESKRAAYDDYDYVFPIQLAGGASCEVYVRTSSTKQLLLPIQIGTADALSAKRSVRDVIIGIYFGVMLVLLFYNLFIFLSTKDRSYGIYVIYISLVGLTQAVFMGVAKYYLWPASPWFAMNATVILTVITAIVAVEFMRSFVLTSTLVPGLNKWLRLFYALLLIGMIVRLAVDARVGYRMLQPITASAAVYQLVIAIIAYRRGSRPAGFFLLAWTIFLLGIVAYILKDVGLLPYSDLTKYTMTLGSAMEGILLSFGLADKINILRKEKERSQEEALKMSQENEKIIREQNVVLETKVKERTHALNESNEHLKRTQSQLVNAEKMASVGQLTAGIAHEINNPVNFITSNIPPLRRNLSEIMEVLAEYRSKPLTEPERAALTKKERDLGIDDSIDELKDIIGSIEEGAGRTAEIVRGLRNFSRLDEDDLKPSDVNEGLRSTLTVLGPQIRDHVDITLDLGELPRVECFPGKLNQVFMNMLTNAAQAVKARHGQIGGQVHVTTRSDEHSAIIAIRDNGIGMPEEVRTRIFEPFFTTKDVGEGTGLGLSIAYSIIEKHHGRIEVDSVPGEGTEFRIILPIAQPNSSQQSAHAA